MTDKFDKGGKEAPKSCLQCPLANRHLDMEEYCDKSMMHEDDALKFVPGPECPWVLLDAKDADIERLRRVTHIAKSVIDDADLSDDTKGRVSVDTTRLLFLRAAIAEGGAS